MRRHTRFHNPEFDAAAEARIESTVAFFEKGARLALGGLEDPSDWRYEEYFDLFVIWLNTQKRAVVARAREILEQAEDYNLATVDNETLLQAVSDPTLYSFGLSYIARPGWRVWSEPVGPVAFTGAFDEDSSSDEVAEVLRRLKELDIVVEFENETPWRGDSWAPSKAFTLAGTKAGWHMEARLSRMALVDKLRELIAEQEKSSEPDEVVYRYAGTNDTVAGASARGFYVATLRPDQLRAEGAALGICVGKESMGYKRKLMAGEIQIFSIRTEVGESKFCIERLVRGESELNFETNEWERLFAPSDIAQIKGTANRLPGFEPAAFVLTKPDEVRLVVEFLQALGYKDETIARMVDIGPGVETMLDNGINPFIPPPKRARPALSPEEREARKQAAMRRRGAAENPALIPSPATAAMIREDYAHPWGGRWGT